MFSRKEEITAMVLTEVTDDRGQLGQIQKD